MLPRRGQRDSGGHLDRVIVVLGSIRTKPSSCSLVSAKGPSVTRTCPPRTLTVVAVERGLEGMSNDEVTARPEQVVVAKEVVREGVHLGSGHGVLGFCITGSCLQCSRQDTSTRMALFQRCGYWTSALT